MLNTAWPNPEGALLHEVARKIGADILIKRERGLIDQSLIVAMPAHATSVKYLQREHDSLFGQDA